MVLWELCAYSVADLGRWSVMVVVLRLGAERVMGFFLVAALESAWFGGAGFGVLGALHGGLDWAPRALDVRLDAVGGGERGLKSSVEWNDRAAVREAARFFIFSFSSRSFSFSSRSFSVSCLMLLFSSRAYLLSLPSFMAAIVALSFAISWSRVELSSTIRRTAAAPVLFLMD